MTKERWKMRSGLRRLGKFLATAVPLLLMGLLLTACPTRKEVDAEIWQNSGLPVDLCAKTPDLAKYGIYRKLDSGKYEFISYCTQVPDDTGKQVTAVQLYISVNAKKFKSFLDALLPERDG